MTIPFLQYIYIYIQGITFTTTSEWSLQLQIHGYYTVGRKYHPLHNLDWADLDKETIKCHSMEIVRG